MGLMYTLIIIDDEQKILDGMVNLFPWEKIGFRIIGSFLRAKEAFSFLSENEVDVALTDIEMPDMTGLELSRMLAERKETRVVIFSSYQNFNYLREAIRCSVADYLLKPVKYDELLACFGKIKATLDAERRIKPEIPKNYYESVVADVKDYLAGHYQDATLEKAAQKVNLSPTYLSRIFKEKSGTGFAEALAEIRMERAKEMLDDIKYKQYEIAYYLGYENPKNFSRAFSAHFHMSPSEYRNRKSMDESGLS
jgi:two-component system, response regulator YesN